MAYSISEFVDILRKIDLRVIEYHLRNRNNRGNYFADWICDVFGDDELASMLESRRYWTIDDIVNVIEAHARVGRVERVVSVVSVVSVGGVVSVVSVGGGVVAKKG